MLYVLPTGADVSTARPYGDHSVGRTPIRQNKKGKESLSLLMSPIG